MLRAMDSAVAGLRSHQNKLDVIGHNIANVNTFGFKAQSYSFKEAMYQTSSASTGGSSTAGGTNAAQYGYGTMTGSITTDMTASTPSYVGGLNASINGQGFFVTYPQAGSTTLDPADLKAQELNYTRVGQFSIDSNGYLVDSNGNFVYGFRPNAMSNPTGFQTSEMHALRAPAPGLGGWNDTTGDGTAVELSSVQINELGEITATVKAPGLADDGKTISLGKVAIATFQNPEGLTKTGGYYYTATSGDNSGACSATEPGGSTSKLMTGYIEASNVDLAKEFAEMITTQRGFQANTKMITVSDEILNELVNMKR